MDRNAIFTLLLLGIFAIAFRWYVYDTDSFLVTGGPRTSSSPAFSATPSATATPIPVVSPLDTPVPTAKPTPQSTTSSLRVVLDVPFASQAPLGEWDDPHQQDACEETSVIMAMHWVRGTTLTLQQAKDEILELSAFGEKQYGTFHDTSIGDTFKFFQDFYGYADASLHYDIVLDDIKKALIEGNIVIVPVDGRLLNNPHFTPPGPNHHMLVIKGFDDAGKYFITNEPGTRYGESYRYSYTVMDRAIRDYPTGYHEPLKEIRKGMIIIKR